MPNRKPPQKSAEKSAAPGIPFQRGHDPRRGRGPRAGAPNAGRPRNGLREACRAALEKADGIGFIARVMRGDALQAVGVDKHGRPVLARPRIRDRLHAAKLLIEHGYGKAPREAELEDEQPQLTREELVAHIVKMLPRVLPLLPLDGQELARSLAERRQIELLVQGKEIKDGGNGNRDATAGYTT